MTISNESDCPYIIEESEEVGRYMEASKDIEEGETVFVDRPAAVGPDNSSSPSCLGCHVKVDGSCRCPDCGWSLCSLKCSKKSPHIKECSFFKERKSRVRITKFDQPCGVYDAILPLRVLLLKYNNPKIYKELFKLMDHNEVAQEPSALAHRAFIVTTIRDTLNFKSDFSETEIVKVMGILNVNAFVIQEGVVNSVDLIGVYPLTSLMSHGCVANTRLITTEDFSYICISVMPIRKGQSIDTNYHHYSYHLHGTKYRRSDLKSTWSFDCCCDRCKDPTEMETYVSSLICYKCDSGKLCPMNSLDYESSWQCTSCSELVEVNTIEEKVKKFETAVEAAAENAEELEKLLKRIEYVCYENHYLILEIKMKLINTYGHKPEYELTKLPIEKLDKKIQHCNHLLKVVEKLSPGKTELRGVLLLERSITNFRSVYWRWLMMKISTSMYQKEMEKIVVDVQEVIDIFKLIRKESDEGRMSVAATELFANIFKELKLVSKNSHLMDLNDISTNMLQSPAKTHSPMPVYSM